MALQDIVLVTISRETQSVARTSFGIPCIITEFADARFSGGGIASYGRAREFANLAEMVAMGFVASSSEHKMATAIFSQNPKVRKIVIGRKDATDSDWGAAITQVRNVNDTWYGLVAEADGSFGADMVAIAAHIQTLKKMFFVLTTETGTLDPTSTTDLAKTLMGLYDRTAIIYHLAAKADEHPEAGWMGEGFPFEPGSSTWAYKTLAGVTPDNLTSAQKTAAQGKNCNTYTNVGGVNITEKGITTAGEFIDIMIGIDWLEARLMETVYGALVNERKIAYDDSGIQAVGGLVRSVLDEAGRKGILQSDTIVLTLPKYAEIPQADRIARHLPDITFTALLQGAIHTVAINGTVSV